MRKLSREELICIVERLLAPDISEDEEDRLASQLDEGALYPDGASLLVLFWDNHFPHYEAPPVDEIVERILSYRPIVLPVSTES